MQTIGVGVIGMGWMGTVHARSYGAIIDRFYDGGIRPRLVICADNEPHRAESARDRLGFEEATTDWRAVIDHPAVAAVNIASPNFLHREMCLAALAAGKNVFCEKPVGVMPSDTAAVYKAARDAGLMTFVGLNYRWAPLVQHARQLIADGRLGEITNYQGRFFANYAADPLGKLSWRFLAESSGTGILGDVMPHVADMAHFLAGPIERLVSTRQTFIRERPLPAPGRGTHFDRGRPEDPKGAVTNEDYAGALVAFANGARGTLEVCRTLIGPKTEMSFEVYGTRGALKWDFERLNELQLYLPGENGGPDGYTRVVAGPEHPYHGRFNPGPGIGIGYDDLKVIEAYNFLRSIVDDEQREPGFAQAYGYACTLDAMIRSWDSGAWESVRPI